MDIWWTVCKSWNCFLHYEHAQLHDDRTELSRYSHENASRINETISLMCIARLPIATPDPGDPGKKADVTIGVTKHIGE
ncbi:hypothetical protein [Leptolyngbya sp. AN10]|uniref:hypothetical protein n=1 Tax=Leptolyngbya sp. AN10 TaxID=3423365 RepID=UPI003D31BF21